MSSWANRASQKRVFRSMQPEQAVAPINERAVAHSSVTNTAIHSRVQTHTIPVQYYIKNGYQHRTVQYNNVDLIKKIKYNFMSKLQCINKIVCVYKSKYKNFNGQLPGIGDFIRGCIFIYQCCKIGGKDFDINLRYHPIGKYLVDSDRYDELDESIIDNVPCSTYLNMHYDDFFIERPMIKTQVITDIVSILNNILTAPIKNGTAYISFIAFPIFEISDDERAFMRSKFQFNSFINEKYKTVCESLDIISKQYNVIHLRCGDEMIFKRAHIGQKMIFLEKVANYSQQHIDDKPLVLLTDSEDIKQYIVEHYKNIKVYDSKVVHFAYEITHNDQGIIDTLTDLLLISNSANIISYTNYEHGTGFAVWPAILNNIPYSCEFIRNK
jgi:hypothetical protein